MGLYQNLKTTSCPAKGHFIMCTNKVLKPSSETDNMFTTSSCRSLYYLSKIQIIWYDS